MMWMALTQKALELAREGFGAEAIADLLDVHVLMALLAVNEEERKGRDRSGMNGQKWKGQEGTGE